MYKVPIWENKKDYLLEDTLVLSALLALADREFQVRIWWNGKGPEMDSYDDFVIDFDNGIEFLKDDLRNKTLSLSAVQIRAILRVHAMCNTFFRNAWNDPTPMTWDQEHSYLINHPYWIKISERAVHALSLLKKSNI